MNKRTFTLEKILHMSLEREEKLTTDTILDLLIIMH